MRGLWALLLLAGARALGLGGLRLELARAEDARPLALLLSEAFDASSFALKWYSVWTYELQLRDRIDRLMLGGGSHRLIVAREGAAVVGFVEVGVLRLPPNRVALPSDVGEELYYQRYDASLPTIGNLVTRASHQRRGIASALMGMAEEAARDWGHRDVVCSVDPANAGALRLYEGLGYVSRFEAATTVQTNLRRDSRRFLVMVKRLEKREREEGEQEREEGEGEGEEGGEPATALPTDSALC